MFQLVFTSEEIKVFQVKTLKQKCEVSPPPSLTSDWSISIQTSASAKTQTKSN